MQITAVDDENNLFRVEAVFTEDFVEEILSTDWLNLPWARQEGQEHWARRRIDESAIPWIDRWHQLLSQQWHQIGNVIGRDFEGYIGTAFWLDEPGFTCAIHTDGMMPGSLHLTWHGAVPTLGTSFYWYKDVGSLRCQFPMIPNTGYIMSHSIDPNYQKLVWHAMLTPVPENTFRLTSYSWLKPQ
jgi:hypothetical protein